MLIVQVYCDINVMITACYHITTTNDATSVTTTRASITVCPCTNTIETPIVTAVITPTSNAGTLDCYKY